MSKDQIPYILCAAILFDDDSFHFHQPVNLLSGLVFCGRRHNNILTTLKEVNINRLDLGTSVQGFITSDDRFVNRTDAAIIAYDAGQIDYPKEILYSEDLY